MEPRWEPDPRAVSLPALEAFELSSFDKYDGADREMLAALLAIEPGARRGGCEHLGVGTRSGRISRRRLVTTPVS
jgi:hypothetical protein